MLGGFIQGFNESFAGGRHGFSHSHNFYDDVFYLIVGFTISGCLATGNRWRHLSFVAAFVWGLNIIVVFFGGSTITQWLEQAVGIAICMGIGGGISFLFKRKSLADVSSNAGDDKFYEEVARELQEKSMLPGLWTKAYAEMEGDEAKTRALYIKYRVAQMAEASQRRNQENQQPAKISGKLYWKLVLAGVVTGGVIIVFLTWQHHKANDPLANLPPVVYQQPQVPPVAVVEEINPQQFEENKAKAERGAAVAQYNLGIFYWKGQGVTEDWAESIKWIRMSAEQGYPAAQVFLADRLSRGNGVVIKKDEAEAAKWYLRAAKQNNADAQFSIGSCYYFGTGVPKDYVEAYKWNELARAQGHITLGDSILTEITSEQKAQGIQLAREFKPQMESASDNSK